MSTSPFHSFHDSIFLTDDMAPEFYPQVATPGDQVDNHKTFTTLECCVSPSRLMMHDGDPSMLSDICKFDPQADDFYDMEDDNMSWMSKMPEQWAIKEVLDWISYVAEQYEVCVAGERFNQHTGEHLCLMTRQSFMKLEPANGGRLYDCLQKLRHTLPYYATTDNSTAHPVLSKGDSILPYVPSDIPFDVDLADNFTSQCKMANIDGQIYDYDVRSDLDQFTRQYLTADYRAENERLASMMTTYLAEDSIGDSSCSRPTKRLPKGATRSKPLGRPALKNTNVSARPTCNRGRKRGQTSKGNHLWEFVVEMLSRSDTSSVLCWESKSQGIFRFLQSAEVARLWGRRKNNQKMTYEKLSRAMRFCRKAGYFAPVPRNGEYPKKLVFKFGPKAENWQRAAAAQN